MSPKALPYISLLAGFWGTTLVVSRFALGQYASLTYVALRIVVASACYLLLYAAGRRRSLPRGRQVWGQGAMLGVFATAVPMTFIVLSLQYQSSGVTALMLTLVPALTVLLAHFLLHDEKLSRRKIAGVSLALGGGALLIILGETGLPDVTKADPTGYIMVLIAIASGSYMVIYTRKHMQNLDGYDVGSVRMWVAGLIILPITYFSAGFDLSRINAQGLAALIYAGLIGTFAGMLLDFYNIKRFGATASAMVSILIPIVTIVCGALFLGEKITPGMVAAMILIVGGVAVLNLGHEPSIVHENPPTIHS